MTRRLKSLGLALVAVFAMSSLVASAASATLPDTDLFVADSAPLTLTGVQENTNQFTLAGQAVTCTTAKVTAHVTESSVSEVTTTSPEYKDCGYAGQPASVDMTGCHYLLTGTTGTDEDARAHLVCPKDKQVDLTLNAIKCLITVAPQEAEEGYTITTLGSGSTAELTLHITAKVKVTSHPHPVHGITCSSLTNGTGTLEGTFIVTGETEDGKTHIGITDETTATE